MNRGNKINKISRILQGKILIAFSEEQIKTRNHYRLTDKVVIEIEDQFDPNAYSIEEAEVYFTNDKQDFFKIGDKVLVDFSIFTRGLYESAQMTNENRFLFEEDGKHIYWAFDGTDGPVEDGGNTSELFGKIADDLLEQNNFSIIPSKDFVLLEPPITNEERKSDGGIIYTYNEDRDSVPFFATVFASSNSQVKAGQTILCEAGLSVPIIFRKVRYEYIKPIFILGIKDDSQPAGLKLLNL